MGQLLFEKTEFKDVIIIDSFKSNDNRGYLNKYYSEMEFKDGGLLFMPYEEVLIKSNSNVLRGLHFQKTLNQSRLLHCIYGKAQLIVVEIGINEFELGKWESIQLKEGTVVFVPGHYAIGTYAFDDTLFYMGYGERFITEQSGGIKWDDEELGIDWMVMKQPVVSQKDLQLQSYRDYVNKSGRLINNE